mgnify:CR=1 FL=1
MWRDKKPLVADMSPHARKRASERRISNILIKDIIRKGIGAYHNNWLRVITCY